MPYDSEAFYRMKRWTDPIDGHLLEKFYRDYGVWVAQTPALSVIEWGRYAFDTDEELARFFHMHGHELQPCLQPEKYGEAETVSWNCPGSLGKVPLWTWGIISLYIFNSGAFPCIQCAGGRKVTGRLCGTEGGKLRWRRTERKENI